MKKTIITAAAAIMALLPLSSCLKGEAETYEEWREQNNAYLAAIDTKEYELVVPDWAPQNSVYIKWHNDRSLTADNLVPMSNSTVELKYELEDIEGTKIQDSYSATTGDSLYVTQPNQTVVGFWIALTTMHVGDSATLIIPYPSGYGSGQTASIKPYSNLIYRVKIKGIKAFEKPAS
ncbi:MAG: FKBP-type peptidyl-prolyl cis-trans isomerase [Muribaculaceae bacterium]|nr:FKBP-type peptidyl-prolyl cis-trans isomerase [Muribaculaceae bacterium]